MIITIELPDFKVISIGFLNHTGKVIKERAFTKEYIIEKDQYLEKSEFLSFPANVLDNTLDGGEK